jgi:hypothetical protein
MAECGIDHCVFVNISVSQESPFDLLFHVFCVRPTNGAGSAALLQSPDERSTSLASSVVELVNGDNVG